MISVMVMVAVLTQTPETYAAPSSAQFSRARQALDESLLDYPSARFRDVQGDQRRLCGYVNSKNRMGAYTGWERFLIMGLEGSDVVYQSADEVEMIPLLCDQADPPLPATDYSDRITAPSARP